MVVNIICKDAYTKYKTKKAVQSFYKKQDYLRNCHDEDEEVLNRSDQDHMDHHHSQMDNKAKWDNIMAKLTFGVNVILIVGKLVAAYLSHSLSVISSVVDSVMDITCGAVVWGTVKAIEKSNPYKYPIGRSRYNFTFINKFENENIQIGTSCRSHRFDDHGFCQYHGYL